MQDRSQSDTSDSDTGARRLSASLDRLPQPIFSVLDGGCFENLEDDFNEVGVPCRSLFREGGDREMRRDGPWFVNVRERAAREHVEGLALEMPCAVFWSCPDGEEVLWRHLRTINEILIPDQNAPGNDGAYGKSVKYERVLFRHWDPTVLSDLLPVLTPEQLARFFGPAPVILFNTTEERGLKRAMRSGGLPRPPTGPLRLTNEQIDRLEEAIRNKSARSIAEYLRETAPEVVDDIDDAELHRQVGKARVSGNKLGLHTDEDLGDWAFLYVASRGEVALDRKLVNYVKSGAGGDSRDLKLTPAQRLRNAMESAAATDGGR